jgi:hypothetical protein
MFRLSHFAAPAVVAAALFVGGCAHDRHDDIPLSATEIGEGKESVFFNAPYDGRVYVYDATANKMLYNGELRCGQVVKVDAKANKVLVDNQTAVERDLVNDHRFKIFFDRDENADAARHTAPPAQQTTIVTDPNARTTVTTDPNAPRTTITTDPNAPKTTVETSSGSRTTVTTPDATITTDPNSNRTTVQPK